MSHLGTSRGGTGNGQSQDLIGRYLSLPCMCPGERVHTCVNGSHWSKVWTNQIGTLLTQPTGACWGQMAVKLYVNNIWWRFWWPVNAFCAWINGPYIVSVNMFQHLDHVYFVFNTLRQRQNGPHFPDDIVKCIFLNENVWIPIKISLKLVP